MSIADLLDDWFESPQVKGALAVNGVIGTWAGPYEPGTAYVMAHHSIGDVGDGAARQLGLPGGRHGRGLRGDRAGRPSRSAPRSAPSARVESAAGTGDGRVTGVVLENGEELRAPLVVTSLHPKIAFLDHVAARRPARRLRPRHRALEDPQRRGEDQPRARRAAELHRRPERRARPSTTPGRSRWPRRMEFIERAFQDAREGRAGAAAVQRRRHPHDAGQDAEPRRHPHLLAVHPVGARTTGATSPHTEELEAYADRLIDLLRRGGARLQVARSPHRDIVGPHEMEQEYGLIGGNIFHGELSLEQLFHMRPAPGYADYRTPIAGLYNASSATHAGGGVCGIPGLAGGPGRPGRRRSAGSASACFRRWARRP